jgi:hypothetical protein
MKIRSIRSTVVKKVLLAILGVIVAIATFALNETYQLPIAFLP